jgi:hypothetical protein
MRELAMCERYVALENEQREIDNWFILRHGKSCAEFMDAMHELLRPKDPEPIASRSVQWRLSSR